MNVLLFKYFINLTLNIITTIKLYDDLDINNDLEINVVFCDLFIVKCK